MNLIYQTSIDNIKVAVRDGGQSEYHIEVTISGEVKDTKVIEGQIKALNAADLLRDIYYNGLDLELLAH